MITQIERFYSQVITHTQSDFLHGGPACSTDASGSGSALGKGDVSRFLSPVLRPVDKFIQQVPRFLWPALGPEHQENHTPNKAWELFEHVAWAHSTSFPGMLNPGVKHSLARKPATHCRQPVKRPSTWKSRGSKPSCKSCSVLAISRRRAHMISRPRYC